jgi:hypothetical protein
MTGRLGWALRCGAMAVVSLFLVGFESPAAAPRRVSIPLDCSRGPSGQMHNIVITVPAHVPAGSRYTVRVDGVDSGRISHTGLRYIFDMGYEWLVPPAARYVEGSARVVPGTGSENVRPGARMVHTSGSVELVLPAHVDSGSSYTPPSFEFELDAAGAPGASITQSFSGYHVTANAFLVGDVHTSCEPVPRPFPVAVTRVEAGS